MFINNTGAFLTSDHYQVISIFNANDELDHYQVYYNYESGNRLDINHIIQNGEELLGKLPMNVFNEISVILHKDHMIQGDAEPDADCDVKTDFEAFKRAVLSVKEDIIAYVDEHFDVELHGELHWLNYEISDDLEIDVKVDYIGRDDIQITAYPINFNPTDKEYYVLIRGNE